MCRRGANTCLLNAKVLALLQLALEYTAAPHCKSVKHCCQQLLEGAQRAGAASESEAKTEAQDGWTNSGFLLAGAERNTHTKKR